MLDNTEVESQTQNVDNQTTNPEIVNQETVNEPIAETAEKAPETDAEKRQKQMQRAIDRQTAKKYEAQAEAQSLRREIQQLRERVGQGGEASEPEKIDVEAIVSHRAQEIVAQREFDRHSYGVASEGKKLTGFHEAMQELAQEVPLFNDRGGPSPLMEAVMASNDNKQAAQILKYLGQNLDEAAEFKGLSASQIGRRIALLESKLSDEAKVKTSSAPKPISPINSGAIVTKDPSKMTDDEYFKWRKSQRK